MTIEQALHDLLDNAVLSQRILAMLEEITEMPTDADTVEIMDHYTFDGEMVINGKFTTPFNYTMFQYRLAIGCNETVNIAICCTEGLVNVFDTQFNYKCADANIYNRSVEVIAANIAEATGWVPY